MQLYGSTRSPFVRKVLVAAHELELADRIDLVPTVVSNTSTDPVLAEINPLGQIPTLVTAGGVPIYDSLVICLYLDDLAGGGLVPADGEARFAVLTRHALAQGMLETLLKLFGERRRIGDPLQPTYVDALTRKLDRCLPAAAALWQDRPAGRFDLGDIALAGALAYAGFRFPAIRWRSAGLGAFFDEVSGRPSMRAVTLEGDSPNSAPAA